MAIAVEHLLPSGSRVLELGIGPGVDLDRLAQTFSVVGSDLSQAFLDRYARRHPDAELLRLDAISIDTDRSFDAIYSNKVLHHLTSDELHQSLERQAELLRPGGLLLHGIWAGTTTEDYGGLHEQRYTPETLEAVVPSSLEIVECTAYEEMARDDSLRVVLRPRLMTAMCRLLEPGDPHVLISIPAAVRGLGVTGRLGASTAISSIE